MFGLLGKDRPRKLTALPQSSVGAPNPMILAGEHSLRICYYLEERAEGWDGTTVRVLEPDQGDEPCAMIDFVRPYAHTFGPPGDEASAGHPLANKGLQPYGAYEIESSSWLAHLISMNSVHPEHRAERYSKCRHFILSFHDTTFECIAEDFQLTLGRGNVRASLLQTAHSPGAVK